MASSSSSSAAAPLPQLFFGSSGDEVGADGARYNPQVMSFVRDEWVHAQMAGREPEFTEYRPLRVFVGSYNVNGKFPKEDLTPWLCEGASADGGACMPDLYVVGLQEMVDLTATNVALSLQCAKRAKEWCALLETVLNGACSRDSYDLVGSKFLVGVLVAVLVKRKYRPFLRDVQDATAAVGIGGVFRHRQRL
jgi:hypothetical protein